MNQLTHDFGISEKNLNSHNFIFSFPIQGIVSTWFICEKCKIVIQTVENYNLTYKENTDLSCEEMTIKNIIE